MRFFDFFAGIGGFRLGMEQAGHECVGHCEIDKYAQRSYAAMHRPKESEVFFDDIRTVSAADMPECEVYCFGFPCQSFSIAGKRGGFDDTRGTLFFEVMRLAKERQPSILFAENVKGLLNHDGGGTFATIINAMAELGYSVEWQVLNSKYYLPQNRERIFIIGHLGKISGREIFPIVKEGAQTSDAVGVKTVVTKNADGKEPYQQDRVYDVNGIAPALMRGKSDLNILQIGNIVDDTARSFKNPQAGRIYDPKGIAPCLSTMQGVGREPKIADENGEEIRVRKLTPKECFRLQGFSDEYFKRAAEVNSDSQLYKQAGNSVTVPVIYEIAKRLHI